MLRHLPGTHTPHCYNNLRFGESKLSISELIHFYAAVWLMLYLKRLIIILSLNFFFPLNFNGQTFSFSVFDSNKNAYIVYYTSLNSRSNRYFN